MKKFLFSLLIVFSAMTAVFSLSSCAKNGRKFNLGKAELQILTADGRTVEVSAELALTQEEQSYGYMNRTDIPDGTGMLFVFSSDEIRHFWMKDTPHPLSIAYILSNGRICDILDMTPFSLRNVDSTMSARYALEVPQGFFERSGVSVGDVVVVSDGSAGGVPLRKHNFGR